MRASAAANVIFRAVGLALALYAPTRLAPLANPVVDWNAIGVQTVIAAGKPACAGTTYIAMMHLAVYDAVRSIDGHYEPYAVRFTSPADASQDAAAIAAAHRVLVRTFPAQAAALDAAYANSLAAIADGINKDRGIDAGETAAVGLLLLRANDGREANVPYVPGHGPGIWEPTPPGFLPAQTPWVGKLQPFTMKSPDQFLPAQGPPALASGQWANDYNVVMQLGAKVGSLRTPEQTEVGLFWTDNPLAQTTRAYRQLVLDQALDTADSARLLAMVETAAADSCIGCLNAKYHFNFWRPVTAIRAGGTDGNAATAANATWEPLAVTPNHPEFPAAHGCYTAATSRTLAAFFGTDEVQSTFTSAVTGTTHTFARFSDVLREVAMARVYGGMHYPYSVKVGEQLGQQVAQQIASHYFRPTPSHDPDAGN